MRKDLLDEDGDDLLRSKAEAEKTSGTSGRKASQGGMGLLKPKWKKLQDLQRTKPTTSPSDADNRPALSGEASVKTEGAQDSSDFPSTSSPKQALNSRSGISGDLDFVEHSESSVEHSRPLVSRDHLSTQTPVSAQTTGLDSAQAAMPTKTPVSDKTTGSDPKAQVSPETPVSPQTTGLREDTTSEERQLSRQTTGPARSEGSAETPESDETTGVRPGDKLPDYGRSQHVVKPRQESPDQTLKVGEYKGATNTKVSVTGLEKATADGWSAQTTGVHVDDGSVGTRVSRETTGGLPTQEVYGREQVSIETTGLFETEELRELSKRDTPPNINRPEPAVSAETTGLRVSHQTTGPLPATVNNSNQLRSPNTHQLSAQTTGVSSAQIESPQTYTPSPEVKSQVSLETTGLSDGRNKRPNPDMMSTHDSLPDLNRTTPVSLETTGVNSAFHSNEVEPLDQMTRDLLEAIPGTNIDDYQVEREDGFLQVPHEIYKWTVRKVTRRYDSLVFNCLLRYAIGYRLDHCQMGLNRICDWTGIPDKANVARSIRELKKKGFIEIVQDPDLRGNRATVYRLPVVTEYYRRKESESGAATGIRFWGDSKPKTSSLNGHSRVVSANTGVPSDQPSMQTPTGSPAEHPRVSGSTTIKYTSKESLKDTHSSTSATIEAYLESIKAGGQRKQEREFFEKLMEDGIQIAVIERSLRDLQRDGVRVGEPCHMPMKYLYTNGHMVLERSHKALTPSPTSVLNTSQPAATAEPEDESIYPEGHPERPAYDAWRASLTPDAVTGILKKAWFRFGQEIMDNWAQKPMNVEYALMAHYSNTKG